jgi:hypothetical protein
MMPADHLPEHRLAAPSLRAYERYVMTPIIDPAWVSEEWEQIQSWSVQRGKLEVRRFQREQAAIGTYAFAMLEDESLYAAAFALQLGILVERLFRRAFPGTELLINEATMTEAAELTSERFASAVGVEPELALRNLLFQRDFAATELIAELLTLLMECGQETPEVEQSLGSLFMVTLGIVRAFESTRGLGEADRKSLGSVIEKQLGGPLPKVGRNDPCPCGSGRKFKKCCGDWKDPPQPEQNPADKLFQTYLEGLDNVWAFANEGKRNRETRWLREYMRDFEERYGAGEPWGVPDSLHLSHGMFDVLLPQAGKTMGQLFLERNKKLPAAQRALVSEWCKSYPSFYELVELQPETGCKRLRELRTGAERIVRDVEDPQATTGQGGEIWLTRLLGSPSESVTMMSPLIYPPKARDEAMDLIRRCEELFRDTAGDFGAVMKRAGEMVAAHIVATSPDVEDDVPDFDDADDRGDDDDEP